MVPPRVQKPLRLYGRPSKSGQRRGAISSAAAPWPRGLRKMVFVGSKPCWPRFFKPKRIQPIFISSCTLSTRNGCLKATSAAHHSLGSGRVGPALTVPGPALQNLSCANRTSGRLARLGGRRYAQVSMCSPKIFVTVYFAFGSIDSANTKEWIHAHGRLTSGDWAPSGAMAGGA